MTRSEGKPEVIDLKGLLARDEDFVRAAMEALVQAALEAEMTEAIGAAKGERSETRLSYRSGYYSRSLITRVGTLELRVPQDRAGRFSTELFERYQRSEKALVGTLAEMYVQGVSTRKVKAVTETLCGHSFSASSISTINKSLDEGLKAFAERRLNESYPYLTTDGSPNMSGPCNSRVLRGAAAYSSPRDVRPAVRGGRTPGSPDAFIGFRGAGQF